MNALGWFILGAISCGSLVGLALHVLLAGRVRRHCYEECRAQVLVEFGIRPAVQDGFDPVAAMRWRHLDVQEPPRPEPIQRSVFYHPN